MIKYLFYYKLISKYFLLIIKISNKVIVKNVINLKLPLIIKVRAHRGQEAGPQFILAGSRGRRSEGHKVLQEPHAQADQVGHLHKKSTSI